MKDENRLSQTTPAALGPLPLPLTAWWSGFDYIFGYQIKLVQNFWGISGDER